MKKLLIISLTLFSLNNFAQFVEKPFKHLVDRERAAALKRLLKQPLANTGNYDVKFHRLYLIPDLNSRQLHGTVDTYFEAVQNLNQMEFDFSDQMTVNSVLWHNQNLSFSQTSNRLIISFPQNINAGVLDSVKISYQGLVPNTGLDSYMVTSHGNNVPVVWTLSEPYGAKDWWPCKQELTDKADSVEINLQYPKYDTGNNEMYAVSNGLMSSEQTFTDSNTQTEYKITTWKHRYPITAYLVAFAITNYTKFSETAGISQSFPIDNYVYPENLNNAQAQAIHFLPVMNYFENTFGPYPFNQEKYGQIQFGWGGGMEHQTATFVVNYNRPLIAHELAHQWFGDAVTCGSWHDIWLNEGFATYSEALTQEALDGQTAFDDWKQYTNSNITYFPAGSVYVQDTTDVWRIFDWRLSYQKGAMVLNMLRLKLGDNHFFQGIRNYFNHKKFQFAKTPDFKNEMATESGLNLDEFFNDWIYGQGYPTYTITVTRTGTGQYDILIQQNTSHPSVDFFEMPLPFKFTGGNGQVFETTLDNTVNNQHFTVNTGFEVTNVTFDEHYDIVKGPTTLETILNVVAHDDVDTFNMYPNPAKTFLHIKNTGHAPVQSVAIFSPDGQLIFKRKSGFDHIDINNLSKGIYLLQIQTGTNTFTKKLIKE